MPAHEDPTQDPRLQGMARSLGHPVGEQELAERAAFGDERYEKVLKMNDDRFIVYTRHATARARMFEAIASTVAVFGVCALALSAAVVVWLFV
jgi:hypothetical protein